MSERLVHRVTDPAKRFEAVERRLKQVQFGVPIPAFRAQLNHTIAVPSQTITDITWDDWEIGDDRFFAEHVIVAGRLRTVDLVVPGIWAFNCEIHWDLQFAFDHTILLNDGYGFPTRVIHGLTTDALDGEFVLCRIKGIWPYDPLNSEINPDAPPTAPMSEVGIQVNQNSGVSKDVDGGSFEIYYLGGLSTRHPTPKPPGS